MPMVDYAKFVRVGFLRGYPASDHRAYKEDIKFQCGVSTDGGRSS